MLGGYVQMLECLLARVERRAKRQQCRFEILLQHTVSVIEQPTLLQSAASTSSLALTSDVDCGAAAAASTAGAAAAASSPHVPFALLYCPSQRLMVASRFVVCTASLGILQNSLRFDAELAQRHAHLLQQQPHHARPYDTALKQQGARGGNAKAEATPAMSSAGDEAKLSEDALSTAASAAATSIATSSSSCLVSTSAPSLSLTASPPLASASSVVAPEPLFHQLQAAILFHPPLSPTKVTAIERMGMVMSTQAETERGIRAA